MKLRVISSDLPVNKTTTKTISPGPLQIRLKAHRHHKPRAVTMINRSVFGVSAQGSDFRHCVGQNCVRSDELTGWEGRGVGRRRLSGRLIAQRVSALGGCEETSGKGGKSCLFCLFWVQKVNRRKFLIYYNH